MNKLKTIEEHNKDIIANNMKSKKLTGVECPSCKSELQFTNPDVQYLTSPPQMDVKCYSCDYRGRIYV